MRREKTRAPFIAAYIPIGIQWPGIIMPLVLAWYIITELGSILENAVKMGGKGPGLAGEAPEGKREYC